MGKEEREKVWQAYTNPSAAITDFRKFHSATEKHFILFFFFRFFPLFSTLFEFFSFWKIRLYKSCIKINLLGLLSPTCFGGMRNFFFRSFFTLTVAKSPLHCDQFQLRISQDCYSTFDCIVEFLFVKSGWKKGLAATHVVIPVFTFFNLQNFCNE